MFSYFEAIYKLYQYTFSFEFKIEILNQIRRFSLTKMFLLRPFYLGLNVFMFLQNNDMFAPRIFLMPATFRGTAWGFATYQCMLCIIMATWMFMLPIFVLTCHISRREIIVFTFPLLTLVTYSGASVYLCVSLHGDACVFVYEYACAVFYPNATKRPCWQCPCNTYTWNAT